MSSTLIVEPCLTNNTEYCNTVTPTLEFESCTTNSKQIWLSHYYNYTLQFNPRPRQFWISLHKVFDTKDWWTNSRCFYERSLHSCAPCVTNCGFRNRLSVCRCFGPPCTPTLHLQLCRFSWVTSFHASVLTRELHPHTHGRTMQPSLSRARRHVHARFKVHFSLVSYPDPLARKGTRRRVWCSERLFLLHGAVVPQSDSLNQILEHITIWCKWKFERNWR